MTTIQSAVKDFIRHCRFEKGLSEKTIKAYYIDLLQFVNYLSDNNLPLLTASISKFEMRQYLESLVGLKPKSIKRKVASIRAMFNYLEFDEQISVNPLRKIKIAIKEPKLLPKVMALHEIKKILKTAYRQMTEIPSSMSFRYLETVRNVVTIELLFTTGARVSEIATLKDADINLSVGEVIINGKGKKQRVIQICNDEMLQILRLYRKLWLDRIDACGGNFLVNRFTKPLTDQSIRLLVKRLYKTSGIKKHITPHVFRHSFATLLLEKDVDIKYIQEMLGHSSITITQLYTHVNKAKQKQLLRTKHPRRDLSFSVLNNG